MNACGETVWRIGGVLLLANLLGCPDKAGDAGPATDSGNEASATATSTSSGSGQTQGTAATEATSDSSTTTSTSTGTAEASADEGSSGGEEGCALMEGFSCEMGVDCTEVLCERAGWFDDDGCLRVLCETDDECAEGEICYRDYDCDPDGCYFGSPGCAPCLEDENSCCCGGLGGCTEGPTAHGRCIPAEDKPC